MQAIFDILRVLRLWFSSVLNRRGGAQLNRRSEQKKSLGVSCAGSASPRLQPKETGRAIVARPATLSLAALPPIRVIRPQSV